jgi:hypothetical protein
MKGGEDPGIINLRNTHRRTDAVALKEPAIITTTTLWQSEMYGRALP